jgi:NitT/TauT family transport system substrate-binding protein
MRKHLFRAIASFLFIGLVSGSTAVFGQSQKIHITVSVLKGPTGISGSWLMANPPAVPGTEFSFLTAATADMVVAKLVSGEVNAGVLPTNVAAKLHNAGVGIVVLGVVGDGMVKFITSDPRINSVVDLRASEIYIAGQKATPDYVFRYLLSKAGLEAERDYTPKYNLSYPEIAAALAAGKIANAVLPEPFASQALLLNKNLRTPLDIDSLWTQSTGQKTYPMSVLVVQSKLLGSAPEAVRALASAYAESIHKANTEPQATAKLVGTLDLGMNSHVAEVAIPVSKFVFIGAKDARDSIEALLKVFLGFEPQSIGGKLPGDSFYAQ